MVSSDKDGGFTSNRKTFIGQATYPVEISLHLCLERKTHPSPPRISSEPTWSSLKSAESFWWALTPSCCTKQVEPITHCHSCTATGTDCPGVFLSKWHTSRTWATMQHALSGSYRLHYKESLQACSKCTQEMPSIVSVCGVCVIPFIIATARRSNQCSVASTVHLLCSFLSFLFSLFITSRFTSLILIWGYCSFSGWVA